MAINVRGSLGSDSSGDIADKIKITHDPEAFSDNHTHTVKLNNGRWLAYSETYSVLEIYDSDRNFLAKPLPSNRRLYKYPIITNDYVFCFSVVSSTDRSPRGYLMSVDDTSASECGITLSLSYSEHMWGYDEATNSIFSYSFKEYNTGIVKKLNLTSKAVYEKTISGVMNGTYASDLYALNGKVYAFFRLSSGQPMRCCVIETDESNGSFSANCANWFNFGNSDANTISYGCDGNYIYNSSINDKIYIYSTNSSSVTTATDERYALNGRASILSGEPHLYGKKIGNYIVMQGSHCLGIVDLSIPNHIINGFHIDYAKHVYQKDLSNGSFILIGTFVGDRLYLPKFTEIDLSGLRD